MASELNGSLALLVFVKVHVLCCSGSFRAMLNYLKRTVVYL